MNRLITIMMLVFMLFASCGSNVDIGDNDEVQNVTIMGNPPTTLPEDPVQLVEKYLAEYPYWKGSSPSDGNPLENIYLIKFDVEDRLVSLLSLDNPSLQIFGFDIADDGAITADEDADIELSNFINSGSTVYPLEITMTQKSMGVEIRMLASDIASDEIFMDSANANQMCNGSKVKYYDVDTDTIGDGAGFVAGFVQTRNAEGMECALRVFDHCTEKGKTLAEIIGDEKSPYGYRVKFVQCDCHNGKCMDKLSDTPMDGEEEIIDLCNGNADFCAFLMTHSAGLTKEEIDILQLIATSGWVYQSKIDILQQEPQYQYPTPPK